MNLTSKSQWEPAPKPAARRVRRPGPRGPGDRARRGIAVALVMALCTVVAPASPMAGPGADSLSVGNATHGSLENGKALPKTGTGFRVLGKTLKRGYYYGTSRLVKAIRGAAGRVRTHLPKSTLGIGNLSREGGGDIPQSRSHNSGRDADLAFYVLDRKGNPTRPDDLVKFGRSHGVHNGRYQFDLERNWILLRDLFTNDSIRVDWIFVANWLREPLLAHARQLEADDGLILRAETSLKQPGDSAPHHDHFHLRVYCTEREQLDAECVNYGWVWPWAEADHDWSQRQIRKHLTRALDASRPAGRRAKSIHQLATWRVAEALPYARTWLADATLRSEAVRLVARLGALALVPTVIEAGCDLECLAALSRGAPTAALCKPLYGHLVGGDERAWAALERIEAPCATELAAEFLDSAEDAIRARSRGIVQRHLAQNVSDSGQFSAIWSNRASMDRTARLEAALQASGIHLDTLGFAERVDVLVDSLDESEPMGQNARELLVAYTGVGQSTLRANAKRAVAFWSHWWQAERTAFGLPPR